MRALHSYRFDALPEPIDYACVVDCLSNVHFLLCHDLRSSCTRIITDDAHAKEKLERCVKGSRLTECAHSPAMENPLTIVPYAYVKEDRHEEVVQTLDDIYRMLGGSDAEVWVSFAPDTGEHVRQIKERVEHALSGKEVRLTRVLGAGGMAHGPGSVQSELYYGSDERRTLTSVLEMLNGAVMSNGLSYRIAIVVTKPTEDVLQYIRSRLLVLETRNIRARDLPAAYEQLEEMDALPFSLPMAARMISFSDRIARRQVLHTNFSRGAGGIALGTYMDGTVSDTGEEVRMPAESLNLGTIVTGLPGTGKSYAAMAMIGQLLGGERPMSAIIAPTEEWNAFAAEHGIEVVRLYGDKRRLNFFRCSAGINTERFYENLAMLMASASNAGPYRSSMEKSMLAAFRRVYSSTRDPDPAEVYEAIEGAVIDQHARRSNTGVRYTKHGENIMAALENLRLMLLKPQFAYTEGEDFGALLRRGVVFDLSKVSNNMKPFFYALILNQVYGCADALDANGDNSTRMLICIEEAQLIFDAAEQSASCADLRQRIQDFRKRGVCLVIITHSVTDISQGIRRLCQNKLYFRQSADSVRYAVQDLAFDQELQDAVMDKLKVLEQRVCAASYMTRRGVSKEPAAPIFIKTEEMALQSSQIESTTADDALRPTTRVRIVDVENKPLTGCKVEVVYAGSVVFAGRTDAEGRAVIDGLLEGKSHKLIVFGEKKRDTQVFVVHGGVGGEFRRAVSGK